VGEKLPESDSASEVSKLHEGRRAEGDTLGASDLNLSDSKLQLDSS
jgi:hypothetical protein